MKSAQWSAVLVLALMVGGITFVSVYLGGGGREGSDQLPPETPPALTFPVKDFPLSGQPPLATEVRQTGRQDYWFINENNQDITVGLNRKGCTCSEVEITVAPSSWISYMLDRMAVTQAVEMQLHGLEGLTMLAALNARERLFPELPDSDRKSALLTKEDHEGFSVPAGAIGRVRLSWSQPMPKVLNASATLWIGQRGGKLETSLGARVLIVDPVVLSAKELTLPTVSVRQLENLEKENTGERGWIICGSMTRRHFRVQAELVHDRIKADSDPVEVGAPVPFDDADYQKLAKDFGAQMPTILSGYKVPVTLRARAKDGTPAEWGHFYRTVRMRAEEDGEPAGVQVTGQVLGDVVIGEAGKVRGTLDLGPFPRGRGARGTVILQTDEKDLDLELDTSRMPEYLKASLSKPDETIAGHRLWKLDVKVPPNSAEGEFPRKDPNYRDSAVYLKTKGKPPQSIRVPVMGTANQG